MTWNKNASWSVETLLNRRQEANTQLMQEAKRAGKKLLADFKHTNRNRQMFISYKFGNFKEISSDDQGNVLFENDLSMIQPYPHYIDLVLP